MNKFKAIVMKSNDNVATVTSSIAAGMDIEINVDGEILKIRVKDTIPTWHKVAIKNIAKDEKIIKYGEIIGMATANIAAGEHTHVHNLVGCRGRGDLVNK